ncbi:MAG: c-type cytochrome [Burkholderiales bacterium]|nr:c-type cytochrome [Burkholderiales bacterium]
MHPLHFLLALSALVAVAEPAGDAVHGKALYQERCIACHSVKYNGIGPAHKGVFGRAAAAAPNYDYSPALKASGLTWTPQNLDRWLADPEKLVPGQKMGFKVDSAQERADLIAFLKSVSE